MAEQASFQDPLEDIDPVMKNAFTGGNPIQSRSVDEDEDDFDDSPFQSPIGGSQSAAGSDFDDEDDFDIFGDDDDLIDDDFGGAAPVAEDYSERFAPKQDSSQPAFGHDISDVQFPNLSGVDQGSRLEADVFSSIPVNVSVELGRSKISLREVYELTEGSIIELDRLVGEPLDLVVNGQVIAQGEVVAIDNNYGLRVTRVNSAKS